MQLATQCRKRLCGTRRRCQATAAAAAGVLLLYLFLSSALPAAAPPSICALSQSVSSQYRSGDAPPPVAWVTALKTVTSDTAGMTAKAREYQTTTTARQANAMSSWKRLHPDSLVFAVAEDTPDMRRLASDCGAMFISLEEVETTRLGVPVISSLIELVKRRAPSHAVLALANADIIMTESINEAVGSACDAFNKPFLLIGQRFEIPLDTPLDFKDPAYEQDIQQAVASPASYLQKDVYKDFFVFSRDLWQTGELLPLAMGRAAVDDWIISNTTLVHGNVVDITRAVTAYHQIHDYDHAGGKTEVWLGEDAVRNHNLTGEVYMFLTASTVPYEMHAAWSTGGRPTIHGRPWNQFLRR